MATILPIVAFWRRARAAIPVAATGRKILLDSGPADPDEPAITLLANVPLMECSRGLFGWAIPFLSQIAQGYPLMEPPEAFRKGVVFPDIGEKDSLTGRHLDVGKNAVNWTKPLATMAERVRPSGKQQCSCPNRGGVSSIRAARGIQSWTKNRRANWNVASYIIDRGKLLLLRAVTVHTPVKCLSF